MSDDGGCRRTSETSLQETGRQTVAGPTTAECATNTERSGLAAYVPPPFVGEGEGWWLGKQRARRVPVTPGLPPMQSGSSLAAQRRAVSDGRFPTHQRLCRWSEPAEAKPQVENEGESPVPCKRCGRACVWPIIERPSVLEEDEALLAHLGLRLAIWSGTSLHGSMHPASRSRAVDRSQDILPGGRRAGKRVSWAEGLADDRAPSSRGEWWGVLQEFQRLGGSLAHTIKTGLGLGGGLCQSKPNGLAALLHQRGSMVIVALRDDANEGVQAARENVVAFAGLQKTQDVPCQWCSRRHRGSSTTSPEGKAAGSESGSGNGGCREQARTSPHGPTKVRFRQEGVEEEALVRQGDARQLKTQGYAFCALEETEMYVPPSLQGSGLTRALCRTRWMLAQSLGASHVISPRSSSVALSSATFHAAREKLGYRLGDGYYQLCVHTMTKQSHVALPSTCFETSTCCVQPQHGQAPPESVQEEVTAVTEDVQECQRQPNRQVRALQ